MTEHNSYSCTCSNFGLPNFSTDLFEDFSTSFSSSNSYSVLDNSLPTKTSTPKKKFKSKVPSKFKQPPINCKQSKQVPLLDWHWEPTHSYRNRILVIPWHIKWLNLSIWLYTISCGPWYRCSRWGHFYPSPGQHDFLWTAPASDEVWSDMGKAGDHRFMSTLNFSLLLTWRGWPREPIDIKNWNHTIQIKRKCLDSRWFQSSKTRLDRWNTFF